MKIKCRQINGQQVHKVTIKELMGFFLLQQFVAKELTPLKTHNGI